jgi:5-carboxyvanillate decarboxylase
MVNANRYARVRPLNKKPSDHLKENVFAQQVLGVDRVMYAMDYPYQFVPEEVKVTDELPIGEEDRSRLYHLNAQRVFKL